MSIALVKVSGKAEDNRATADVEVGAIHCIYGVEYPLYAYTKMVTPLNITCPPKP